MSDIFEGTKGATMRQRKSRMNTRVTDHNELRVFIQDKKEQERKLKAMFSEADMEEAMRLFQEKT